MQKGKISRPFGVKCLVYGCGYEWYKGRAMTKKELKEHRCIHWRNKV